MFRFLFSKKEKSNCEVIYQEYRKYKELFVEAKVLLNRFVENMEILKDRLLDKEKENEELKNENEKLIKENEALKKELKTYGLLLKDIYGSLKEIENEKNKNEIEISYLIGHSVRNNDIGMFKYLEDEVDKKKKT
jgi:hypothetical protein